MNKTGLKITEKLLEISPEIKNSNLKKLALTTTDLDNAVKIVTHWFRQQPHLPDIIPEQRRVENIYISCKGSIERTKSSLDMYYTLKTASPDLFLDRDPLYPAIRDANRGVRHAFMPTLTPEGARILCAQFLDTTNFNLINHIKYGFMAYELRLLYDYGSDCIGIFDLSGLKMGHLTQITPFLIKICLKMCQEGMVSRIKGLHIVNVPRYADPVLQLIYSLLSEKLRSRCNLHKSYADLHKVINKKLLPKDFGGENNSLEEVQADWYEALVENRDWFLEQDKYKSDESRRPGKPVVNDLLGTHGSFRKLDVD